MDAEGQMHAFIYAILYQGILVSIEVLEKNLLWILKDNKIFEGSKVKCEFLTVCVEGFGPISPILFKDPREMATDINIKPICGCC